MNTRAKAFRHLVDPRTRQFVDAVADELARELGVEGRDDRVRHSADIERLQSRLAEQGHRISALEAKLAALEDEDKYALTRARIKRLMQKEGM